MSIAHLAWATTATVCLALTSPAFATIWDGMPDGGGSSPDTLITTATNWVGDVAPLSSSSGVWEFGNSGVTSVTVPPAGYQYGNITFNSDAPSYVVSGTTPGNDIGAGSGSVITQNSPNHQTLNLSLNISGGSIRTPGTGGLTVGADGGSYYVGWSAAKAFWLGSNVTFGVDTHLTNGGAAEVFGVNGAATLDTDATGVLILNGPAGTGSTSNATNFTGRVNIWSGAVRVGNSTALGRATNTANNTYVHGTFVANTSSASQNDGTYERGFGRLELYNDVTVNEFVRLDSRIGTLANFDHIVNISGNNTLGSTTGSGVNQMGGAGHFNFNSVSGKLTLGATTDLHVSDGPRSDSTSGVNSVWTFRGDGNFELQGKLRQEAGMSGAMTGLEGTVVSALRKQGSGTLSFSGTGNDWDGGTLIEGGTVEVIGSGDFSMVGSRVHLASQTTLNLSTIGGMSLVAGKTLSGAGTVIGNVVTNDPAAVISPGGQGSLDSNDAIAVATGAGTLTLQNDLDMSGAGSLEWSLASLSTDNPGTDFDQLIVGSSLTLGGGSNLSLDFSQLAGTGPGSGNPFWNSSRSWKIVDTAGDNASSTFATISNGSFSGGTFTTSIVSGDVYLNYSVGLSGDFDGDGDVDGADFVVWQTNFPMASGASPGTGDADGDEDVDGADFAAWQDGFPSGAGASPVPEPQAALLLGIGGLFALLRRWGKESKGRR